ncbi:PH domain-containing protein [Candidatus Chlorohelix sp.]|uniref:PH domain-containing protein n=1 Tax=Candidatus Chlorohelix sp. TaxID=3139201 RepID=UPI003043551A
MNPFEYSRQQAQHSDSYNKRKPRNHWGTPHAKGASQKGVAEQEANLEEYIEEPVAVDLKPPKAKRSWRSKEKNPVRRNNVFDPVEVTEYLGGLMSNEEIRTVYYRHWTHFLHLAWLPLLGIPLLIFLGFAFLLALKSIIFIILFVLLVLLDILGLVWYWVDYRNDRLIVTSIRVIQVEKVMFFKRDTTEIRLDKAQEVRLETARNPLEWLYKTGNITITSMGRSKIVFNHVQYPELLRQEIDSLIMRWRIYNNEARKKRASERIEKRLREIYYGKEEKPKGEPVEDKLTFWEIFLPTRKIITHDERGREIYTWHTHPWFLFTTTIGWALAMVMLFLIYLLPMQWFIFPKIGGVVTIILWVVFVVALGGLGFKVYLQYENWRNDRYIIRPDEFLSMTKLPFGFDQSVGVVKAMNAQDVQSDKPGFMSNLLGFGTVIISTAGQGEPLKFENVPNPEDVEDLVNERIEDAKILREDIEDNRNTEMIYNFFAKNDELKRRRAKEGRPLFGDWKT